MRKIIPAFFIPVALLLAVTTEAKNFYIASGGNDASAGTSPATAWQTIAKLNSSFTAISPGDSILFKSGDIFYGSIIIAASGNPGRPIIISSYGSGARPLISGFTTLHNWMDKGNGIWESAAPMVKSTVNLLTLNGIPQQVGRYPDAAAKGGGYLTYESFTGNNSITDNQLDASVNWTGAEICLKKEGYILERNRITKHKDNTILYVPVPTINPRNGDEKPAVPKQAGFGYFIQRDPRTLSKPGEWYFDKTAGVLQLFSGNSNPSADAVRVSSIDTLVNIGDNQYITLSNIGFEGSNLAAIYAKDAGNISIENCSINCSGAKGIFIWNSPDILVDHCSIKYALCNAIDITGRYVSTAVVRNCIVSNTATIAGMGSFHDPADMKGIYVSVNKNALIEFNKVDTVGYIGIQFQGDSITVQNNFVDYHDFIVDDGGGIYTWSERSAGRVIRNNIILHGVGATDGNAFASHAEGIYTDAGARGIYIYNNTMAFNANRGIYMNDPKGISVYKNTCYSNGTGWGANKHANDSIFNFTVMNNIFYSANDKQLNFEYSNSGLNSTALPAAENIQEALQLLGNIDSNYYNTPKRNGWSWYYASSEGGRNTFVDGISFEDWKSYTGLDASSRRPARITANPEDSKLLYNASNVKATFYLDKKYADVDGKIFADSVILEPYSSKILILETASRAGAGLVVVNPQRNIPYKNIALMLIALGAAAYIIYYYAVKKKKEKEERRKNKIRVRVRRF